MESSGEMIVPIIKITDSSNSETESNNSSPGDSSNPSVTTSKSSNEKSKYSEPNVDVQEELVSNSNSENMDLEEPDEDFENSNNDEQLHEMMIDFGMDEAISEEEVEEKSILKNRILQEELVKQILKKILEAKELFLSQEENEEESFGNEDNPEEKDIAEKKDLSPSSQKLREIFDILTARVKIRSENAKLEEKEDESPKKESKNDQTSIRKLQIRYYELISEYFASGPKETMDLLFQNVFQPIFGLPIFPAIFSLLFYKCSFIMVGRINHNDHKTDNQSQNIESNQNLRNFEKTKEKTKKNCLLFANLILKGCIQLFWTDVQCKTQRFQKIFQFLKYDLLLNGKTICSGNNKQTQNNEKKSLSLEIDSETKQTIFHLVYKDLLSLVSKFYFYYETKKETRKTIFGFLQQCASIFVFLSSCAHQHPVSTAKNFGLSPSSSEEGDNDEAQEFFFQNCEILKVHNSEKLDKNNRKAKKHQQFDSDDDGDSTISLANTFSLTSQLEKIQGLGKNGTFVTEKVKSFFETTRFERQVSEFVDIFVSENIIFLIGVKDENYKLNTLVNMKSYFSQDMLVFCSKNMKLQLQQILYSHTRPGNPFWPSRKIRHHAEDVLNTISPYSSLPRKILRMGFRMFYQFSWPISLTFWSIETIFSIFGEILWVIRNFFAFGLLCLLVIPSFCLNAFKLGKLKKSPLIGTRCPTWKFWKKSKYNRASSVEFDNRSDFTTVKSENSSLI